MLLFLVRQVMGRDMAEKLRQSFVKHRVKHRAAGVVPGAEFHVPTLTEIRTKKRAAATRPVTAGERTSAANAIRRAVRAGEFGAPGTKTRAAALAVARTIEGGGGQ